MIKLYTILREILSISNTLTEVGDASAKPYKWKLGPSNYSYDTNYEFTTDLGTEYKVYLFTGDYQDKDTNELAPAVWIMFLTTEYTEAEDNGNISSGKGKIKRAADTQSAEYPQSNKDWSTAIVTNRGELYRVMATIAEIVQKFLKDNPSIKIVVYEPEKKSSEREFGTKRDMLYRAFIKQAFPSSEILKQGDDVIAKIR